MGALSACGLAGLRGAARKLGFENQGVIRIVDRVCPGRGRRGFALGRSSAIPLRMKILVLSLGP